MIRSVWWNLGFLEICEGRFPVVVAHDNEEDDEGVRQGVAQGESQPVIEFDQPSCWSRQVLPRGAPLLPLPCGQLTVF